MAGQPNRKQFSDTAGELRRDLYAKFSACRATTSEKKERNAFLAVCRRIVALHRAYLELAEELGTNAYPALHSFDILSEDIARYEISLNIPPRTRIHKDLFRVDRRTKSFVKEYRKLISDPQTLPADVPPDSNRLSGAALRQAFTDFLRQLTGATFTEDEVKSLLDAIVRFIECSPTWRGRSLMISCEFVKYSMSEEFESLHTIQDRIGISKLGDAVLWAASKNANLLGKVGVCVTPYSASVRTREVEKDSWKCSPDNAPIQSADSLRWFVPPQVGGVTEPGSNDSLN